MNDKQHTVIAILEAVKGKENELKLALKDVIEPSRAEASNIEYRLHKNIDNPQQYILYENWESKEKHMLQFEKPYIKDLANKLDGLLAKPFELYLGEEI